MSAELISDGVEAEMVGEGFYSARDLTYIRPQKRRLSEYEAVICNAQPDLGQFDSGGWYLLRPDGLGCQDARTTALGHPNWFEYRDPSGLWQRPYIKLQAQQERLPPAVGVIGAVAESNAPYKFPGISCGAENFAAHGRLHICHRHGVGQKDLDGSPGLGHWLFLRVGHWPSLSTLTASSRRRDTLPADIAAPKGG